MDIHMINDEAREKITDKNVELYHRQVDTLKLFLKNGAITKAQFDKSYGDLTKKMGMQGEEKMNG